MINVRAQGATPNDGGDDTAAINKAIAAGTSIYFPQGNYRYRGRITLPANKAYRIYGDGPGVSNILFTGPTAVLTSGWVEGFYMSGFEIVLCGIAGHAAIDLQSSQAGSPSPDFNLMNGHLDFFADGVRMTNLSAVKVCHVDFNHTSSAVIDGSHLVLTNCIAAIVTDCTFTSQTNKINNENGVFLSATQQARVSGNIFRNLYPLQTGSPIVAFTGSKTVRVSENIFKNCRNSFDNYIGGEAYYDADNVIAP